MFFLNNVMNNDEINIRNFNGKEKKTTLEKETSQFSLKYLYIVLINIKSFLFFLNIYYNEKLGFKLT